jgi:hypothetical protein
LVGDGLWSEINGSGGSVTVAAWNGGGGSSGKRGGAWEVRGKAESGARLFIAVGKVSRQGWSTRSSYLPVNGGSAGRSKGAAGDGT